MLLLALGAVVVGFAFLVVSLLSQDAGWAWGCIAACGIGAGFVVADAVRRRRAPRVVDDPGAVDAQGGPGPVDPGPGTADPVPAEEQLEPAGSPALAVRTENVLVVDENPEFHVDGCSALHGRTTIALPLDEAVDLGFTPCARCTPADRLTGGPPRPGSG